MSWAKNSRKKSSKKGFTMTRLLTFSTAVAMLFATANSLSAQAPTTVQLPSFSSFSYNGTVLVPDRGATYLGGVNRSATGMNRRGLSRGFGTQQSIGQAVAHAHIIDNNEIDRQILGGSPTEFLRRERLAKDQQGAERKIIDPDSEGKALVRHARKEYKAGKQSAAFASYQLAIQVLASPRLRDLAKAEFKRVFGSSADQALRMSQRHRF